MANENVTMVIDGEPIFPTNQNNEKKSHEDFLELKTAKINAELDEIIGVFAHGCTYERASKIIRHNGRIDLNVKAHLLARLRERQEKELV